MGLLKVYKKKGSNPNYPVAKAYSVHIAIKETNVTDWTELNLGYGILFAEAAIRPDNTIEPKTCRQIKLLKKEASYYIIALLADEQGNVILPEKWILWETSDFITFSSQKQMPAADAKKYLGFNENADSSPNSLSDALFDSSLDSLSDMITIEDTSLEAIKKRWLPVRKEELTTNEFFLKKQQKTTPFPLVTGFADPDVFSWDNKWYYIATNDTTDAIGLFVRESEAYEDLFTEKAKQACILEKNPEKGLVQTFWAPEFHLIGGKLYIFFAVSGNVWGPQCQMMCLKENGHILNPNDWEDPIRVCRPNGSYLTETGITLDMTHFEAGGKNYLVWSERYNLNSPLDSGSMLMIATTDPATPWTLTSEPVLLARPLFAWENIDGTINNEGPFALCVNNKIYLAYSGGHAYDYSYAVGYIVADADQDLLDLSSWQKEPAPVLCASYLNALGDGSIIGPGHCSFFKDPDGEYMIAYHGVTMTPTENGSVKQRATTMHSVYFGENGFPFLHIR